MVYKVVNKMLSIDNKTATASVSQTGAVFFQFFETGTFVGFLARVVSWDSLYSPGRDRPSAETF